MPWQSLPRHRARHTFNHRRIGISRDGRSEDRTDRVSTQYDAPWQETAAARLPSPARAGIGPSCECFARGPRRLHDVIDLASLERIDRTLWSIEKGRLLFQEAPCSARLRKNLQYSVDPGDQLTRTQDLLCRD